jgi:hypothetical protein
MDEMPLYLFYTQVRYKSERCNRFSFLELFIIIGNDLQVPVLLVKCDLPFPFADRAYHFLRDAVAGIVLLWLSLVTRIFVHREMEVTFCCVGLECLADPELFIRDLAGPVTGTAVEYDHGLS